MILRWYNDNDKIMPILITVQLWYFPKWVGAARLLAGARYLRPALAASYTLPSSATLQISYSALYICFSWAKKTLPAYHILPSVAQQIYCCFYRQITLAAFYSPLSTSAQSCWQFPLQITLVEYKYLCRAPDRVWISLPSDPPPEPRMHISGQH